MELFDTVIVGAGQAGLGVSYFLQKNDCKHIVFERERVGDSWLSQRWDSFKLNTPNFMNNLPGFRYDGLEPDGFWKPDELVYYFQTYIKHFKLPVQTGVNVVEVGQPEEGGNFIVKIKSDEQGEETVLCRSVVIASGSMQMPKIPAIHSKLPDDLVQLHTADYHNAAALPPGAVVVVGSGQSGCQITEDLLSEGRIVYLCTSKVGRIPRRYRGKDTLERLVEMKFFDVTFASLEDKAVSRAPQPQISGLGRYGHTVSLQSLASQGAVILGRLQDVEGNFLLFNDEAAANLKFADLSSQQVKEDIDAFLLKSGIALPPNEEDLADLPDLQAECVSQLRRLDLHESQVSTIIWATGFTSDFKWIRLPVFDVEGELVFQRGISPVRGLYFIGFPWLSSRKSGIIYGIEEDAQYIADAILKQLA